MKKEKAPFPHCDANILHAPKECIYCDEYPEKQQERSIKGINYTGHTDSDKLPCPAMQKRPFEKLNKWHGNKALRRETT